MKIRHALATTLMLVASYVSAQEASPQLTLTIATATNVDTLDPQKTNTIAPDLSVISQLYQSLVTRGPDLRIKPSIASSWKQVKDSVLQFELKPGLVFPNGEKLDAAAVKWNIERVLDPKTAAKMKPWFDPVVEVKVLSPTSVQFITKKPYPALLGMLTMFYIMPPKWASENNPSRLAVGTGPYNLKEFVSGDRIVLEAKKDYRGDDKPVFQKVIIKPIPEGAARLAALMAGEVDFASQLMPADLKRINDSGKGRAGSIPSTRTAVLKFNNLISPLKDNISLRQGINYAIDKQGIINSLLGGLGTPAACQIITPAYAGYNTELKPYPYDPEKAKKLIAASGYKPSDPPLELEVPLGRYANAQEIGQVIASELQQVGLNVKIVEENFSGFLKKAYAGNLGALAYYALSSPSLDADGVLSYYESTLPYGAWHNKEFDALISEARVTADPSARNKLYGQATSLMCKEVPGAFLWVLPSTYAISNRVEWNRRGDDWIRATDFSLRKAN